MFKFSIKYKNKGRERGNCQGGIVKNTHKFGAYPFIGINHSLINKRRKKMK